MKVRQLFLGRLVAQELGYLAPEGSSIWLGLLLDISGQGVGCCPEKIAEIPVEAFGRCDSVRSELRSTDGQGNVSAIAPARSRAALPHLFFRHG
jgi:hypothetical protein